MAAAHTGQPLYAVARGPSALAGPVPVYGGAPRLLEFWHVPGIVKFKANWNQFPLHDRL